MSQENSPRDLVKEKLASTPGNDIPDRNQTLFPPVHDKYEEMIQIVNKWTDQSENNTGFYRSIIEEKLNTIIKEIEDLRKKDTRGDQDDLTIVKFEHVVEKHINVLKKESVANQRENDNKYQEMLMESIETMMKKQSEKASEIDAETKKELESLKTDLKSLKSKYDIEKELNIDLEKRIVIAETSVGNLKKLIGDKTNKLQKLVENELESLEKQRFADFEKRGQDLLSMLHSLSDSAQGYSRQSKDICSEPTTPIFGQYHLLTNFKTIAETLFKSCRDAYESYAVDVQKFQQESVKKRESISSLSTQIGEECSIGIVQKSLESTVIQSSTRLGPRTMGIPEEYGSLSDDPNGVWKNLGDRQRYGEKSKSYVESESKSSSNLSPLLSSLKQMVELTSTYNQRAQNQKISVDFATAWDSSNDLASKFASKFLSSLTNEFGDKNFSQNQKKSGASVLIYFKIAENRDIENWKTEFYDPISKTKDFGSIKKVIGIIFKSKYVDNKGANVRPSISKLKDIDRIEPSIERIFTFFFEGESVDVSNSRFHTVKDLIITLNRDADE